MHGIAQHLLFTFDTESRYHDLVEILGAFAHLDGKEGTVAYLHTHGVVADVAEFEYGFGTRNRQTEVSVQVGNHAIGRSLFHYTYAD